MEECPGHLISQNHQVVLVHKQSCRQRCWLLTSARPARPATLQHQRPAAASDQSAACSVQQKLSSAWAAYQGQGRAQSPFSPLCQTFCITMGIASLPPVKEHSRQKLFDKLSHEHHLISFLRAFNFSAVSDPSPCCSWITETPRFRSCSLKGSAALKAF